MTARTRIPTQTAERIARPALLRSAAAAVAMLVAFLASPCAQAQVLQPDLPKDIRGLEVENHLGTTIPLDLTFTNEKGESVPLSKYFNRPSADGKSRKPVVMMMVYYRCPMLCPLVLEKFGHTLGEIDFTVGKDFDTVIVSFDPRDSFKDAALQKKAHLMSYGREEKGAEQIEAGWNFLTSTPEHARKLGDALGFPYRALSNGEFGHGACVFVLTPDGRISRYLTGLNYPAKDVRLALMEASGGKIGGLFDAVTLWCYHYDPAAGSYSVQAMRVMRVGVVIMTVLVAGLLLAMLRFEKLKKRRLAAAAAHTPPGVVTVVPGHTDAAFTGHMQ